jgi:hypothetical protein
MAVGDIVGVAVGPLLWGERVVHPAREMARATMMKE